MAADRNLSCKYCSKSISPEMIFNSLIICGHCGLASQEERRSLLAKVLIYGGMVVFTLGLACYFKDPVLLVWDPNSAFKNMSEDKAIESLNKCLHYNDRQCLIAAYRRLDQLNPDDLIFRANLAMQLTRARDYTQADPIYRELITHEEATHDIYSFYALNLEGLKEPKLAIEMYEKSIALEPDLRDVTMRLTSLYMKSGRTFEAESLANSFTAKFPAYESDFAPILRSKSLAKDKVKNQDKLRLVSVDDHFQVPISMSKKSKAKMFTIDTGATTMMMPTSDAATYFPELMEKAMPMEGAIADGSRIRAKMIVVPSLKIGNWDFKNVAVAYCDTCSRLAGMNLLKKLKMHVSTEGELSSLSLSR